MKKKPNCLDYLLEFDLDEDSEDSDFQPNSDNDGSAKSVTSSENSGNSSESSGNSSDEENESSDTDLNSFSKNNTKDKNQKSTALEAKNQCSENVSVISLEKLLDQAKHTSSHANDQDLFNKHTAKILTKLVCCACLGDRSDYDNEIVECDGCGITVHEGCYGVSDSASISSTVSSCSTEPWFCEACKANVKDPNCELCPNRGGIFKETDVGKWVHLVCALYVPGVAFGEVDQLSSVTLFEMQYSKWGAKLCSLCEDDRFARSGVCIGCDAGMCKTYFHVTCAQRAGLLSEAHHEEADQADPFYAHCKLHSDKTLIKNRQRNFHAVLLRIKKRELDLELKKNEKPSPEQERIERKLKKHRLKYVNNKQTKPEPWVPTQKMQRLLNTSASACKKLRQKTELMKIDETALEFQEAQIASLTDIRKKWHIPPAFSVEFIGYYLDRTIRLKEMKENLQNQLESNNTLLSQQQILRDKYDESIKLNQDATEKNKKLISEIETLHSCILSLCPTKQLAIPSLMGRNQQEASTSGLNQSQTLSIPSTSSSVKQLTPTPTLSSTPPPQMITSRTMSVPTAAALKMGVGFPLNNLIPGRKDESRILSTQCPNNEELCGICKRCTDQHLLAKCDTCHLYYHLGCLNPPLTRHPKKSKLYGWQCSECDKSDDSGPERVIIPKAPRRSRIRYSKDGSIIHASEPLSEKDSSFNKSNVSTDIEKSESEYVNNSVNEKLNSPTDQKNDKIRKPKPRYSRKSTASLTSGNETDTTKNGPTFNDSQKTQLVSEVKVMIEKVEETLLEPVVDNDMDVKPAKSPQKQKAATKAAKKEKRSLTQISKDLHDQKMQENTVENEVKIVQEPAKSPNMEVKSPKAQQKINNISLPRKVAEAEILPDTKVENVSSLESIELNGSAVNGETTEASINDLSSVSGHHKHKKRKDKERDRDKHHKSSRHSHSPISSDRQSSKEHKRKRKRKNYDMENPNDVAISLLTNVDADRPHPRIKIKFKAIPLPHGSKKTSQMFYQTENMDSRPMEMYVAETVALNSPVRNNSVNEPMEVDSHIGNGHDNQEEEMVKINMKSTSIPSRRSRPSIYMSPGKRSSFASSTPTPSKLQPVENLVCDTCHVPGTTLNLVRCDECLKNYHFQCLDPPLKKTPKRRGYSWHCADCDPTDIENK